MLAREIVGFIRDDEYIPVLVQRTADTVRYRAYYRNTTCLIQFVAGVKVYKWQDVPWCCVSCGDEGMDVELSDPTSTRKIMGFLREHDLLKPVL